MTLELRPSLPSDFDQVLDLYTQSYGFFCPVSYPEEVLRLALPIISQPQSDLLAHPNFRVCDDQSGIIAAGGWTAEMPGTGAVASGLCHIRHVAVLPGMEGRGIGRRLVESLEADALAKGFEVMEAFSTLNAVRFYQALGFERLKTVTVHLGTDKIAFEALHMRASLAGSVRES